MTDVLLLPGIIAPAAVRYALLLEHLEDVNAIAKDLEVYAGDEPPADYSIETEVAGIAAAADRAGLDRFHLVAHSAGAACSLAFAAAHPGRVLSLALDEPASDFSEEDLSDPVFAEVDAAAALPEPESTLAFLRLQLAPGVEPPPPPGGEAPPWMATRPAGMRAFVRALTEHRVDPARYEAFGAPVLYTYGSLSHPRWLRMEERLAGRFPDFTAKRFEGLHHLNPAHLAEPAQTAALLRELWERGEPR